MAALYIVRGPNEGAIISLVVDHFMIGRLPDCDICIPMTHMTRQHARIVRVNGTFFIEDLNSRNGTYVNGSLIGPRSVPNPGSSRTELKHGDRIRIVDYLIADFLDTPCFSLAPEQSVFDQRWRTSTVLSLVAAGTQDQAPPLREVDGGYLGVLSDALEEAGCTEQALLEHLRSAGPHIRACWALCRIRGEGWTEKRWA